MEEESVCQKCKKRKMMMLTNGLGAISVGDDTTTVVQALEESPPLNLCCLCVL